MFEIIFLVVNVTICLMEVKLQRKLVYWCAQYLYYGLGHG